MIYPEKIIFSSQGPWDLFCHHYGTLCMSETDFTSCCRYQDLHFSTECFIATLLMRFLVQLFLSRMARHIYLLHAAVKRLKFLAADPALAFGWLWYCDGVIWLNSWLCGINMLLVNSRPLSKMPCFWRVANTCLWFVQRTSAGHPVPQSLSEAYGVVSCMLLPR